MSELENNNICKNCKFGCCEKSTPFLLKNERQNYSIKFKNKCNYLINSKCSIYKKRPIDCRIFPISLKKFKNKFYWILVKNCPLSKKINLQKEIEFIEKVYLSKIKKELEDYDKHPCHKWFDDYKIIQEINIK